MKKQLPTAAELKQALLNADSERAAKAKLVRVLFEFASPVARTDQLTQGAADRAEQGQRNLHIAFALAAYQRDHKNYPKTLDALAPNIWRKFPTTYSPANHWSIFPMRKGIFSTVSAPMAKTMAAGQILTVLRGMI